MDKKTVTERSNGGCWRQSAFNSTRGDDDDIDEQLHRVIYSSRAPLESIATAEVRYKRTPTFESITRTAS